MTPILRVLWYIYTRNLVQKGGNFTHFTKRDYALFAAVVGKMPINIGQWVFEEMTRFRFGSRITSHIPFPSLISVILFHFKIWHVGAIDTIVRPPPFGKPQLHLMKLSFEGEGSGHSRAPTRTRASHSRAQEAHSAATQPPFPSDLAAKIQEIVDAALDKFAEKMETEVGKIVSELTKTNHAMVEAQDGMKAQLDLIMKHLGISAPSPSIPTRLPTPPVDPSPSFDDDKGGEETGDQEGERTAEC